MIDQKKMVTDKSEVAKPIKGYSTNSVKALVIPGSENIDELYE